MSERVSVPIDILIKQWKHTEELIKHFDEIRVRLRLLGTTIYFAALGVAFTPLTFQSDIQYIGNYGLSSIIFFITLLFSFTLLLMERYFKGLMHQAINRSKEFEKIIEKYVNHYYKNELLESPFSFGVGKQIDTNLFKKILDKISKSHIYFWLYISISSALTITFLVLELLL